MNDLPSDRFTFPGTSMTINRLGFGPKRLAGPGVWGPPLDNEVALKILCEAITLEVDHLDTSDYYGPHVINELIHQALSPYPRDLVVITKVGHRRAPDGSWPVELSPEQLTRAVHDNLCHLGLETLDVVNLRVQNGPRTEVLIEKPLSVLVTLQQQGLIRHLGLSNITPRQFIEAQRVAKIVCVQKVVLP